MTVETSHGKRRPRVPRPGETEVRDAVLAAPLRDATTGRWLPRNQASRLRTLKRAAALVTLDAANVAPWVRPLVEMAQRELVALVAEVGAEGSASLTAFAEAAATAHAMQRAFLSIAGAADADEKTKASALAEARQWMKEHRQSLLCLRAEARAGVPARRKPRSPFLPEVTHER